MTESDNARIHNRAVARTAASALVDRELTLRDMLADPIVQTLMRRDRVKPETIIALFAPRQERNAA